MNGMNGTSWQQRYRADEIYTLRCEITEAPEMLGQITTTIGQANASVSDITLVEVTQTSQIRDFTVYTKSKDQLDTVVSKLNDLQGVTVIKVTNEVYETHRRGSIDIKSRMPIKSLTDLRMVYTPGVASVCKEIEKDPTSAWDWTGICDRVAIVTNGTAVLGLGDIGVLPSLPVMEGKASIFAEFVDISAFPILVDSKDPKEIIDTVLKIAPTFGAIQLEDIAAPACFEIEQTLREKLNIPVFHDDQHGTSTVLLAAMINALKQTGKKAADCSAIMLGAGAAGYAISKILLEFGIKDIVVYDSAGALYNGRTEKMNPWKQELAEITNKNDQRTPFAEGFKNKDIFIGVACPNMVTKEMIASMNPDPLVFPLSNPVGEITIEDALEAGAAAAADGRGINNALAYPAIFRGALDARATEINLQMQMAAAKCIAQLAPDGQLLPDILDKQVHAQAAKAVKESWGK